MTDDDLRQRLIHLQDMLDQLGGLWFMKLDLKRLFGDTKVMALGHYAHSYLWLLARMWENGGYVAANDRVMARLMELDTTVWRRTYKPKIEPMLARLPDAHLGAIYSQITLVEIMTSAAEERLKNRDRTAAATAARKSTKSKQRAPVTKTVTKQRDDVRDDVRDDEVFHNVTSSKLRSLEEEQGSAPKAESPVLRPIPDDGSLRPAPNGHVEAAAPIGSRSLEGREPPEPDEPIKPTPALLKSPLVAKAKLTGLMAALQHMDTEEDDDGTAGKQD